MKKTFIPLLCALCAAAPSDGHEEERFSTALIHPIELHHAHNESEFGVNALFREDVREVSFELAWASADARLGIEAELPFLSDGLDWQGESVFGLGDIEIEPIRYSWIADREAVFTTSLGLILPTGDEADGLGEGKAFFEPHFLAERVFGSWHFAANFIPGFELGGEHEKTLGWGVMAAYSFRLEGTVRAVSLELTGESSPGEESEEAGTLFLTPGIHGHIAEREFRLGLRIPVSSDREETWAYFISIAV